MPTLTQPQRTALRDALMRTDDNCGAITKPQLVEVIAALDDWWNTPTTGGAAAANAALPQPQRGLLTAKQKARLFQDFLAAQYGVS